MVMALNLLGLAGVARAQSGPVTATTVSTRLELTGRITMRCSLTITPDARAGQLNLLVGASVLVVARLVETCNGPYGVTVQSRSGGELRSSLATDAALPYQVIYDGQSGSLRQPMVVERATAATARAAELALTFAPATRALPGVYSDELTLLIQAR